MEKFDIKKLLRFIPETIIFRGEKLYEDDCVSDIFINQNVVTAKVWGTREYKTEIHFLPDGNMVFHCSCPYDGGTCKHSVALAFEIHDDPSILEEISFDEEKEKVSGSDIKNMIEKAGMDNIKTFLSDVLSENYILFERFRTQIEGQTKVESDKSVAELAQEIVYELESFDLMDYQRFYEHERNYSGYRSDWEILFDGAEAELEELMKKFTDKIDFCIESGNVIDSLKHLLALYEAIHIADFENITDEVDIFHGNIFDTLWFDYKFFYDQFLDRYKKIRENYDAFCRIVDIISDRVNNYQDISDEDSFRYDFKHIDQLLTLKIDDTEKAEYARKAMDALNLPVNQTDSVYEKIFFEMKDQISWLELAENQYTNNIDIARKLLKFYENDRKSFVRIAEDTAFLFKFELIPYLAGTLKKDDDPDLYKKVLFQHALEERTIAEFKAIKQNLSDEDIAEFLDIVKGKSLNDYYISILSYEKRHKDILDFAKRNRNSSNINRFIEPILTVYPEECYGIITAIVEKALEHTGGAEHYRREAHRLRMLLTTGDEKVTNKVYSFAEKLMGQHSRRSSMKREFIDAGILKK
jgi:hypothetical protein